MSVHDENNHEIYRCRSCGKYYPDNTNHKCETRVVNIFKEKYDVYIGRAGHGQDGYFGNPYPLTSESERGLVLERYKEYFLKRIDEDLEFKKKVLSLKGKVLGCFCKPKACHGDIIKEWLDREEKLLHLKKEDPDYYDQPKVDKKLKRVAVVGSRNYNNKQFIFEYLHSKLDKIGHLVSGGCPNGADFYANEFAKKMGLSITIHYPNWNKDGKVAGFIRNKKIVEDCEILIAFWTGSGGTKDSIEYAKKLGKKTIIHRVEPDKD